VSNGHSFKKWHLKLAMFFIDVARCNAYITWKMALGSDIRNSKRDLHREFMLQLTSELITGKWKEAVNDEGLMYCVSDLNDPQASTPRHLSPALPSPTTVSPSDMCNFSSSMKAKEGKNRNTRKCKICQYEGRGTKIKTVFCNSHKVCLCFQSWNEPPKAKGIMCPNQDWTCWEKFHRFYLPEGLFYQNGHFKRNSKLFLSQKETNTE
jgi:hypothetical protein